MPKVIITAQVEDNAKWEAGFRSHTDLFSTMAIDHKIEFTMLPENYVALCADVKNIDTYMGVLQSPATADAMAFDGVKRDTVKVYVLDKEVAF